MLFYRALGRLHRYRQISRITLQWIPLAHNLVAQMYRLTALAFPVLLAMSCAATSKMNVELNGDGNKSLHNSKCRLLSTLEVSTLPEGFERANVCLFATLYADREFTVAFPSDRHSASTPWDVTVMLPRTRSHSLDLEQFDGRRVLLIGNLSYDHDCWAPVLKGNELQICTPVERPIYLSAGTMVILK